jgi:hypothetical protein
VTAQQDLHPLGQRLFAWLPWLLSWLRHAWRRGLLTLGLWRLWRLILADTSRALDLAHHV